jgi:hypothetical protein
MSGLLEPVSLLRPVDSVSNIRTRKRKSKQHEFHKEPCPAPLILLLPRHTACRLLASVGIDTRIGTRILLVQVMRPYRNDVVVVGQLTGFSGETEVRDGRDFEVGNIEACCPFVDGLVLELEFEVFVLEVGEFGDGGDLGVADASGLDMTC